MKLNPMNIVFIGAMIAIVGGVITAIGTWKEKKASSSKMQNLQTSADKLNDKSEAQLQVITSLKTQNSLLQSTIDKLNKKTDEQEGRILALTKQNTDLSLQLAKSTDNLYGNITGGNSFCELAIQPESEKTARMMLISHGDYPLYEINIRIVDLDEFKKIKDFTEENIDKAQVILNVGNLTPKGAIQLQNLNADFRGDRKAFNIFFSARNGFHAESLRLFKIKGVWKRSVKIDDEMTSAKSNKHLYEKTDAGIPPQLLDSK